MSEENTEKPKNKIVFATLKMPDGKEHEIPLQLRYLGPVERDFMHKFQHWFMKMRYMVDKFKYGKKLQNKLFSIQNFFNF